MNASRAVAQLRRNDPNYKVVSLTLLREEQDDAALGQALERNDVC